MGGGRHEDVEPEIAVGAPQGDLVEEVGRGLRDLEVGDDGPALLAEPGLVQTAHVAPVEERRGAQRLRVCRQGDAEPGVCEGIH